MKINMVKWLVFIVVTQASAFSSLAQLKWEAKQQTFSPKLEDKVIVTEFKFENKGKNPLTVISVKTSCGCTTAELDKKKYNPGDKGVIKATFQIGSRTGFQQKHILVETDYFEEPITQLTIEAEIPELVSVDPPSLIWKVGDANVEKELTIKINPKYKFNILEVKSTNYALMPQLKIIKAGQEYKVMVKPSDLSQPQKATFIIESDFGDKVKKQFFSTASVE